MPRALRIAVIDPVSHRICQLVVCDSWSGSEVLPSPEAPPRCELLQKPIRCPIQHFIQAHLLHCLDCQRQSKWCKRQYKLAGLCTMWYSGLSLASWLCCLWFVSLCQTIRFACAPLCT